MDGNGRWATGRDCPARPATGRAPRRCAGSSRRRRTRAVGILTLYAFSADNWRRPAAEVAWLMRLFREYLRSETPRCVANGVRLEIIGRRDRLGAGLLRADRGGRGGRPARGAGSCSGSRSTIRRATRSSGRPSVSGPTRPVARLVRPPARDRRSWHAGARAGSADPHRRRAPAERLPALGSGLRRAALPRIGCGPSSPRQGRAAAIGNSAGAGAPLRRPHWRGGGMSPMSARTRQGLTVAAAALAVERGRATYWSARCPSGSTSRSAWARWCWPSATSWCASPSSRHRIPGSALAAGVLVVALVCATPRCSSP